MYRYSLLLLIFIGLACNTDQPSKTDDLKVTKIAFGSCAWEQHELPILNNVVDHKPDLFIFLGDNIYGDTKEMDTLKVKYNRLASKASFINLKSKIPIIATWDDHDYGWNDIGKEYQYKEESKEIFLDFFDEPEDSPRRDHKGIYHSYIYPVGERVLQVILLDGRTFRDALESGRGEMKDNWRYSFYEQDYSPTTDTTKTLLGSAQWIWLQEQLRKPADIRLIGSGTQFGIEYNGYEAWANFPHEQRRMIDLIESTRANGVIFISGDVHYSEISKLDTDYYPIYDFTSSGLSSTWSFATPNKNRIEGPIMDNHFGLISISHERNPSITMETWDINDNQRIEYTIKLSDIKF